MPTGRRTRRRVESPQASRPSRHAGGAPAFAPKPARAQALDCLIGRHRAAKVHVHSAPLRSIRFISFIRFIRSTPLHSAPLRSLSSPPAWTLSVPRLWTATTGQSPVHSRVVHKEPQAINASRYVTRYYHAFMPPKGDNRPRFPAARIKKMMQADDDVGRIASGVPPLVCALLPSAGPPTNHN